MALQVCPEIVALGDELGPFLRQAVDQARTVVLQFRDLHRASCSRDPAHVDVVFGRDSDDGFDEVVIEHCSAQEIVALLQISHQRGRGLRA